MRVVQPSVKVLPSGLDPFSLEKGLKLLRGIESFATRKDFTETTDESSKKFVYDHVILGSRWDLIEHFTISAKFLVDQQTAKRIRHHRLTSYSQKTVIQEEPCDIDFIYPLDVVCGSCMSSIPLEKVEDKVMHVDRTESKDPKPLTCVCDQTWLRSNFDSVSDYIALRANKWSKENALSVLGYSVRTDLVVTKNLRGWRDFFLKRTTKESANMIYTLSCDLLAEFVDCIPLLYADIRTGHSLRDNVRLPS